MTTNFEPTTVSDLFLKEAKWYATLSSAVAILTLLVSFTTACFGASEFAGRSLVVGVTVMLITLAGSAIYYMLHLLTSRAKS